VVLESMESNGHGVRKARRALTGDLHRVGESRLWCWSVRE
jgi:hypothetical protein